MRPPRFRSRTSLRGRRPCRRGNSWSKIQRPLMHVPHLVPGVTIQFRVRACNHGGWGLTSEESVFLMAGADQQPHTVEEQLTAMALYGPRKLVTTLSAHDKEEAVQCLGLLQLSGLCMHMRTPEHPANALGRPSVNPHHCPLCPCPTTHCLPLLVSFSVSQSTISAYPTILSGYISLTTLMATVTWGTGGQRMRGGRLACHANVPLAARHSVARLPDPCPPLQTSRSLVAGIRQSRRGRSPGTLSTISCYRGGRGGCREKERGGQHQSGRVVHREQLVRRMRRHAFPGGRAAAIRSKRHRAHQRRGRGPLGHELRWRSCGVMCDVRFGVWGALPSRLGTPGRERGRCGCWARWVSSEVRSAPVPGVGNSNSNSGSCSNLNCS